MNILILGSGGREHALAWKLAQSPLCDEIYVAPGNAGTNQIAKNIPIDVLNFQELADFSLQQKIHMIVVGPEVPLVHGIVDFFRNHPQLKSLHIIGPDKKGAQLEGSKDFSKNFMNKYKIPTAASRTFYKNTISEGLAYLKNHSLPIVLKADGLAAGKGVIIAGNLEEANDALHDMLTEDKFGEAGSKVVIEEYLHGIELSVFVISDGSDYVILPEAKDYKRIGEGDTGPNTGGMGAVSPVPFADEYFLKLVDETVIKPTIQGLQSEGINYTGFIFFGLMNVNGKPFVIEYNARLGDPESEVIIPRIQSDLAELFLATAEKKLAGKTIEFSAKTAVTVMLVAGGYPESYEKGNEITGLEMTKEVIAFHAGTKLSNGKVFTNGGRVMAMTALGISMEEALAKSNQASDLIQWKDKYFRKDIGQDLFVYLDEANSAGKTGN